MLFVFKGCVRFHQPGLTFSPCNINSKTNQHTNQNLLFRRTQELCGFSWKRVFNQLGFNYRNSLNVYLGVGLENYTILHDPDNGLGSHFILYFFLVDKSHPYCLFCRCVRENTNKPEITELIWPLILTLLTYNVICVLKYYLILMITFIISR